MAYAIQVAGAALIRVDVGAGLVDLGYTEGGADVRFQPFMGDVPCDDNGGHDGPPADIQYFGEIAHISLVLSKWDAAVAAAIGAVLKGGVAGTPGTPGTLIFAGSYDYRLLIASTNLPLNFPRVVFREPREIGKASKYSRFVLNATAYKNGSGVLYNATTS